MSLHLNLCGKQSKSLIIWTALTLLECLRNELADAEVRRGSGEPMRIQRGGKRTVVKTLKAMYENVDIHRDRAQDLEEQLGIDRWDNQHPDYLEAVEYRKEREFRLALDRLERLIVQCLMEIQKCHVRGTSEFIITFY
jgi:hypothetical protein